MDVLSDISHEKTWMWLRKGNLTRETESLLIAAQTTPYQIKIDKMLQNSRYSLCVDRDETINHMISECSKLTQKEYNTRYGWVDKVIHRELCKKFQFDHMNKWYMYNPESVLENNMHKLLWDFDIQTDHQVSARRPDLIIIIFKKENLQNCELCCPG